MVNFFTLVGAFVMFALLVLLVALAVLIWNIFLYAGGVVLLLGLVIFIYQMLFNTKD